MNPLGKYCLPNCDFIYEIHLSEDISFNLLIGAEDIPERV